MTQSADVLFLSFMNAAREKDSEERLARLIEEHATPIIKDVIRGRLHLLGGEHSSRQEAEDLNGEVMVKLLAHLRTLGANSNENPIKDFRGYVAVVTYNVCHHHLRQKYPARWRLKNRLRYLLTHRPGFALWEDSGGDWLCGFEALTGRGTEASMTRLRQLADDPGRFRAEATRVEVADLLDSLFRYADGPVRFDDLLGLVARLQGVSDHGGPAQPLEFDGERVGKEPVSEARFATELERRSYLRRLWREITQLPPMQRAALLLNLRDPQENVITLLPLAGVAGVRQIGEQVGMLAEEFAPLWNRLPLEDSAIAELLGVTRQQVINLRKAARARLARRMRLFGEPE